MGRIIYLLLFLAISPSLWAQKKIVYKGSSYSFELSFVKSGNSKYPDCSINEIKIINKNRDEHVQSIAPPKNVQECKINKKSLFVIADINFDGYEDIRMRTGNHSYVFWVFDPNVEEFIRYKELELLSDPYLDFDKKEIVSSWTFGCCRSGSSHYKYVNNKLTLIEEKETFQLNNDSTKFIVKRLVDGNMRVIEEGYQ